MMGKELRHVERVEQDLKHKEDILENKENRLEAQSHHGPGSMFNPMNGMLGEPHIIKIHSLDDSPMMPPPGILNMLDSIMRDKIRTGPVQSMHFGPRMSLGNIMRPGPHPNMVAHATEEKKEEPNKEQPKKEE